MIRLLPLSVLIAGLCAPSVLAQAPPRVAVIDQDAQRRPTLVAQQDGKPLTLGVETAKIDIDVAGHLAQTRLTLTFRNPHGRVLAGDLYVPLPEGATVSGYGLDIDNQLVDAVVVDKVEARRIFEKETRKGVDPGLIEWSRGNVFKTRVFPIPARGTRTIRVSWVQELEAEGKTARYRLPLRLPKVDAEIRVSVAGEAPTVKTAPLSLRFKRVAGVFVAEGEQRATFDKDLILTMPATTEASAQVERGEDGAVWFVVRDTVERPASAAPEIRGVRVVWDASMSRHGVDHGRTIRLLDTWLAGLSSAREVELVVFRNVAEKPQTFALPGQREALIKTLKEIAYDGGTTLGDGLFTKRDGFVNVLVSDGGHDFGAATDAAGSAPIYAIGAGNAIDRARLSRLATGTGGAYVSLTRSSDAEVVQTLGKPVFQLIRVSGSGVADLTPGGPTAVAGPVFVAGRLPLVRGKGRSVTLEYGYGGKVLVTHEVRINMDTAADSGGVVRRFWAQQRLGELLSAPTQSVAAIRDLGKTHGLVTPHTSLLVLETLAQHIEHNVEPPTTRVAMHKGWLEAKASEAKQQTAQRASKLEEVLAMWKTRVAWWEKTYTYPKNFRYGAKEDAKSASADRGHPRPASVASPGAEPAMVAEESASSADRDDEARPVAKKAKAKNGGGDPVAAIALTPWNPDTPYLRAIKAASIAGQYAVYLKERDEHGTAPAFYLDCADFFSRANQPALALRVLSNLAELELEDVALTRVLAHRLTQWEGLDLAVQGFEAALEMRPEEPQSYRDLALVLARRAAKAKSIAQKKADYTRALALLEKVIMGRWDRFAEIEAIALTELNNIWPAAKAAGVSEPGVDSRLIKQLDMDIRIVMNWDADMTDMDLHVVEPSTERAYYGHNRTTIGGMVTRDFTAGYGPEVYALRKAMHGEYQVKTKFYGSSAAQLLGAVTLQVDVYTNYGRATEQRKSMTLRLTESGDDFLVGTIEL